MFIVCLNLSLGFRNVVGPFKDRDKAQKWTETYLDKKIYSWGYYWSIDPANWTLNEK